MHHKEERILEKSKERSILVTGGAGFGGAGGAGGAGSAGGAGGAGAAASIAVGCCWLPLAAAGCC